MMELETNEKCIICGDKLIAEFTTKGMPVPTMYKCSGTRVGYEHAPITFQAADLKDQQNWSIRHIRDLETKLNKILSLLEGS